LKKSLDIFKAFYAGLFCWSMFSIGTVFASDLAVDSTADMTHGAGASVDLNTHHDEGGGGLPQLDASTFPSQVFWLAVSFAILYMIFSKKSLPEISGVIENRHQHIQADLESAEKLKEEASAAQHAYETSLAEARNNSAKILHDMYDHMASRAEKKTNAFRDKTEKNILDLETRLHQAKEIAMEDMNTIAAEVAREAARKIVGIHPDLEQAKTVVRALNDSTAKAA